MASLDKPCLIWTGKKNTKGYGWRQVGGIRVLAHRAAYCEHHNLPLSAIYGMLVRHRCDVRLCTEPSHLEIGTAQQNSTDMIERGRSTKGRQVNAVLTSEQVIAIRWRYKSGCKQDGCTALAKEFGVGAATISRVINKVTY